MEAVKETSKPPGYRQTSPEQVVWSSVPDHQPKASSEFSLPGIRTITSPQYHIVSPSERHGSPHSVRSLPPIDPGSFDQPRAEDTTMGSPMETGSVMSMDERAGRSTSAVSIGSASAAEVTAAEVLSGLGNPRHYARSSRGQNGHVSSHANGAREPEPLLELVSQAHPWVGGSIRGSMSVYETTKYYSPRIVQYGVNFMERNIGTPIVNTVGTVGTMTGVGGQLRRHLDSRRPQDIEAGAAKSNGDVLMEVDGAEQLPPYPTSRPPSYREEPSPHAIDRAQGRPAANRTWSSRVFVTTSGLSVALSTTSRQSLRFCLKLLASQFQNVESLTKALSMALNNYEETRKRVRESREADLEKGQRPPTPDQDDDARRLAQEIRQHCDTIWSTIQNVVQGVSRSVGGALPQNAREFVRAQLMSLPQRWRIVSDHQANVPSETSRAAQRMIDFATEGLDMMTQVSGVLKATLDSAEQWLATVGRSDATAQDDRAMTDAPAQHEHNEKS
ncbi:Clock-controlled protein 8 [Fulvia fulva]|uniref:Clock-controlled protein 8 n=1 Tax=Passalora fulva TaxID=5499 RepID=A0A9Q8PBF4_PASFU|nr:Clock-controlled protein 8 [Fulvia fulva]KAK4622045.1 Clock-controlled protein 8 [Fulvia fulva]KAK4622560.1 Clock-controlled protein 8 [Fulvia fulva]UJO19398.1 Clock-controlled protein 8 [Fulvia fulva]WPV15998.1 Clock-controlled protein 8 [Fulvia fulva]WPV30986.1 Clock-controlled protein 8 [Fulvia fulva]